MDKSELAKLLTFIGDVYSEGKFKFPRETEQETKRRIEAWGEFIGEYKYQIVKSVVKDLISEGNPWPPEVGEIKSQVDEVVRKGEEMKKEIERQKYLEEQERIAQKNIKETEEEFSLERESESELEGKENESDSKSDDPSEKYNDFAPTTSRGLDYEQIKELWNDRVPEALQIRSITDKRKRHLRARYKESDFALNDIINAIQEQPFLLGENDRGWVADFTWIIENQDHYTNILERKYKDDKFNGKTESEYIKEL